MQAMQGDEQAFEELHRRLGGGLCRFLQRRVGGRPELIEELSQMAWVEVWRALHSRRYNPERARITTFVYAIAYKMVLRHLRSAGRPGEAHLADEDAHETLWASPAPEEALHFSELLDAVRDCLHRARTSHSLTAEERAVVAGVVEGESERALGKRLGLAASTINARKKSAYEKMRNCLGGKGFTDELLERGLAWSEQENEEPGLSPGGARS